MLPFTRDEFMAVFARYHIGTWPAVLVWFILAAFLLIFLNRHISEKTRAVFPLVFLGSLWSWTGAAYMWSYFASINPAANLFGLVFVIQGVWFFYEAGRRNFIEILTVPRVQLYTSLFLFFYALVLYPWIGSLFGHRYPAAPVFGLPCPNTIFTFATLMLITDRFGCPLKRLLIIPVAWTLVATSAAIHLSVPEDWMLPVAAIASVWLTIRQSIRMRPARLAPVVHV